MDSREKEIYKVTLVGSAVNALLIVVKLLAGIMARSSALVADAIHSLSDFVTDVIVLVFVKIAGKPSDADHSYGHGKYETLATMIIGVFLVIAGIGLLINGVEHVLAALHGEALPRPGMAALVVALLSILSKEWLYRYTLAAGSRVDSPVLKANALHHRSDAVSSLGTLLGIAGAMFLGEQWRLLDPVAAIIVSLLIMKSGYDIMKPSVAELLERSLPKDVEDRILALVLAIKGIENIHHLRTRRIGTTMAIDFHALMDGNLTLTQAHALASEAERVIREEFGRSTIVSIHMEPNQASGSSKGERSGTPEHQPSERN